jgi:hypothetical protein
MFGVFIDTDVMEGFNGSVSLGLSLWRFFLLEDAEL